MPKIPLIDELGDARALTQEDFVGMRPSSETHPALVKAHRRARGPQKTPKKGLTTIRLDADIVEHFKRSGRGWQTRINNELRKAVR